jgi:N-methylhydantoinase A
MSMQIAVDVGGTFTDLVVQRAGEAVRAFKAATTPGDVTDGVIDGLRLAAEASGSSLDGLLAATTRFAFGTTTATNAILENKAARTGLIATRGFRDTLVIREGGKSDSYNMAMPFPPPYIPRELVVEVDERVTAEGSVEGALDEASVLAAIDYLRDRDVKAVAVALLWSIANPCHENRIGALLAEHWPDVPTSLSHRVNPCIREYRRTSATALDASLKPVGAKSVRRLENRLRACGFAGTLTFVTSSGGQTSAEHIVERPVHLCFSGPSAAPEAGRRFAEMEKVGDGNVITVDMGGTSFDVSIVSGGVIPSHREGTIAGHVFGVPSVEVHTIGAGGGSIARTDAGGFVHAGPQSAGSRPGPACYGCGGEEPTVTDANLVCGYLDGRFDAAGGMSLSRDRAVDVIVRRIAGPLGQRVEVAANLVALACEQAMVAAIEDLTVKRGIDPREYVMVAGGAAAGLHAAAIARELGVARVVVPSFAGVLSAFGILTGNIRFGFARSHFTNSAQFDFEGVNAVLAALEAEAVAYLDGMQVAADARRLTLTCEARYRGQVWQLTLPVPVMRISGLADLRALVESFHRLHEGVYAVRSQNDAVEITEWNLQAVGLLADVELPKVALDGRSLEQAAKPRRMAYFREVADTVSVPVFDGRWMPPDAEIAGPAIVDEPLTTIVVPPAARIHMSVYGNYLIDLD